LIELLSQASGEAETEYWKKVEEDKESMKAKTKGKGGKGGKRKGGKQGGGAGKKKRE
jgi:hypothetical protein